MRDPQEYQAMPWMIEDIVPPHGWPSHDPLLPPAEAFSGDHFAAFLDAQQDAA